jgi:methylenetetrahydrofolate reductase (NADPH)
MTALWRAPGFADLLRTARYEVLPTAAAEQLVLSWVPRELTVAVATLPGRGIEPTVDLAERLAEAGYNVVPHLHARLVRDRFHLAGIAARLTAAGISDVFVLAEEPGPAAGRYSSVLALLEDLDDIGRPFARLGITGYPGAHSVGSVEATMQALSDKRPLGSYMVSNMCFDPAPLRRWIVQVRGRGVTLPLLIGLAGPLDRTQLLATAARAGVGESARFLASHADWLVRLGLPGGYSPARFLSGLSVELADNESGVAGLYLFTFNQVRRTEQWRRAMLGRIEAAGAG